MFQKRVKGDSELRNMDLVRWDEGGNILNCIYCAAPRLLQGVQLEMHH